MAGACNHWTGAALQEQHLGAFDNADLSVIAGARHDVIWDNPKAALRSIRAFLKAGNQDEWQRSMPPRSVLNRASAANPVLRAQAAKQLNSQFGLEAVIRCDRFQ